MEVIPAPVSGFGAEIRGVDVTTVDEKTAAAINAAVHEHCFVYFRKQKSTVEQYLKFGSQLGTLMPYPDKRYHHPEHPALFVSSNVDPFRVGMARSGYFWHTDLSFMPKPQAFTLLYPQVLPKGKRDTLFINMANIFAALPEHLRALVENRSAQHDPAFRMKVDKSHVEAHLDVGEMLAMGRAQFPAPTHPCVITHPITKKRILYINQGFTTRLNGLSHEDSDAGLAELFAFIDQPEHIKSYSYEDGDMVLWDNRMLIHRAGGMAPGEKTTIYRLGIDDEVPFYEGISA